MDLQGSNTFQTKWQKLPVVPNPASLYRLGEDTHMRLDGRIAPLFIEHKVKLLLKKECCL